ncbi:hypothetical protein DOTSEDRAFT_74529 [Dothistroma septosporum NZE10]|uniref:Uncharacterized protein n=1 Tax=Dothistroma septosporum (strain NZE10 / CBS 128990) TaxID=675120 RepID=N1PEF4_DOTSN|nr:hypothetical protein DOTSEDRAFT_74529 [Dothistroma septosporum NZE10]
MMYVDWSGRARYSEIIIDVAAALRYAAKYAQETIEDVAKRTEMRDGVLKVALPVSAVRGEGRITSESVKMAEEVVREASRKAMKEIGFDMTKTMWGVQAWEGVGT